MKIQKADHPPTLSLKYTFTKYVLDFNTPGNKNLTEAKKF